MFKLEYAANRSQCAMHPKARNFFRSSAHYSKWILESSPPLTLPVEIPLLMEQIANRDSKALKELYQRFSKVIYNIIFSILKKKEDSEEILEEVFFQVWEKAPQYDITKGSVYTWMLTLARNRAIDRIRSKGFKGEKSMDMAADVEAMCNNDHTSQLDQVVLSERAVHVKTAMNRLSSDQRQVLQTAYFEGQSQTEIATSLGIPLGTVKSRVRDGMKAMQFFLKDVL